MVIIVNKHWKKCLIFEIILLQSQYIIEYERSPFREESIGLAPLSGPARDKQRCRTSSQQKTEFTSLGIILEIKCLSSKEIYKLLLIYT